MPNPGQSMKGGNSQLQLETAQLYCQQHHADDPQYRHFLNELEDVFKPLYTLDPVSAEQRAKKLISGSALPPDIQTDFLLAFNEGLSQRYFDFDWIFEKIQKSYGESTPHVKEARYVADTLHLKDPEPVHLPFDVRSLVTMLLGSSDQHRSAIKRLKSALRYSVKTKEAGTLKSSLKKAQIILSKLGGNPNFKEAIHKEDAKGMQLYLDAGIDPNKTMHDGLTHFIDAVNSGKFKAVKLFINHKSDVNYPNLYGITPIMAAAFWGQFAIAKLLAESGADLEAKDEHGRDVFTIAREKSAPWAKDMLDLLEACRDGRPISPRQLSQWTMSKMGGGC